MTDRRDTTALSAGKNPKKRLQNPKGSKGIGNALEEPQHTIPSGYEHAALIKPDEYIGVTQTEHITDANRNGPSEEDLVAQLENFIRDCDSTSNLAIPDGSSVSDPHPPNPNPCEPCASVSGSSLSGDQRELAQETGSGAMKGRRLHTPCPTDRGSPDVVYDDRYDTACQEQDGDNSVSSQRQGTATQDLASKNPSESHNPVQPMRPHCLSKAESTPELQTRAPRGPNDVYSRDHRNHERRSIACASERQNTNYQASRFREDWSYTNPPQVRRSYEGGTTQNRRVSNQTHIQQSVPDLPVPSIKDLDSEDAALGTKPREKSFPQTRHKPDAAVQQQRDIVGRGETRDVYGALQCNIDGQWKLAVRLDEIRARIMAEEKRKGTYDYPWAKGKGKYDETSYHPAYKRWGWERNQRPNILFQFERNDCRAPSYALRTWIDRGRIVLDPEDNPIKLWREIPLLCSSNMSGAELEAISRTNPDMPLSAIRARMPAQIVKGQHLRPLFDLNTMRMRMGRLRMKAGCMAWNEREGSRQIKHELAKILGARCIYENSTRSFGRDLMAIEVDRLKGVNKGTVPQRSRKKRAAESDNESHIAPTPKRQKAGPNPFSQKHSARHAQTASFGTPYRVQGSAQQFNDFITDPRDQKHSRKRPVSDESEDDHDFLSAKRPRTGPSIYQEHPRTHYSHEFSRYPPYRCPSVNSLSLPSPEAQVQKRKLGPHWAEANSDEETDNDELRPPTKRRNSNALIAPADQVMRSALAVPRRPSQTRSPMSPHVRRLGLNLDDNIQFLGSRPRRELTQPRTIMQPRQSGLLQGYISGAAEQTVAPGHSWLHGQDSSAIRLRGSNAQSEGVLPFANNRHGQSFSTRAHQTEEFPSRASSSRSLQPSASRQIAAIRPTPSLQTRPSLSREPLASENSVSPTLQAKSNIADKSSGDGDPQFAPQLPANALARQALQTNGPSSAAPSSESIQPLETSSILDGNTTEISRSSTDFLREIFGDEIVPSASQQRANATPMRNSGENALLSSNDSFNQQGEDLTTHWDPGNIVLHNTAEDDGHSQQSTRLNMDFRYVEPRDVDEEIQIQKALAFTRNDFRRFSGGLEARETPRDQSYSTQHMWMQAELAEIWPAGELPPLLFYFNNPWYSFTGWRGSDTAGA